MILSKKQCLTVLLVFQMAIFSTADFEGIDEKCSACNAIIYELDRALRLK